MATRGMQVQRYLLLLVAAAGLVLLAQLLRTGWLQAMVAALDVPARRTFRYMVQDTPELRGYISLAWFHYLLIFTLVACFVQVLASLLKPVRNAVLLTINWAIVLTTAAAMLYFWAFAQQPRTAELAPWLTIHASVLCCSLAMHFFARAFLAYPVPMTDERVAFYHRRYMLRPSGESTANKHTRSGRRRRAMLAWELKLGRSLPLLRSMGRSVRREKRKDLSPRPTRLLLLYGFPGATLLGLSALWSAHLVFGETANWAGALIVLPIFAVLAAWAITMEKIQMDYRLGDATIRKQVLWLFVGMTFPAWACGVFFCGLVVSLVTPAVLPYVMLFVIPYAPLLAFLMFVVCLMVSIFFYGAIDPERVLRASALYSFLGLVLTVIFAIVEQLLSPLLTGAVGLDGTTGALASAVVVAVSFRPLHRYIEGAIARTFQKLLHVAQPLPPTEASSGAEATKSDPSASPG
jgi:hypothetical protein